MYVVKGSVSVWPQKLLVPNSLDTIKRIEDVATVIERNAVDLGDRTGKSQLQFLERMVVLSIAPEGQ